MFCKWKAFELDEKLLNNLILMDKLMRIHRQTYSDLLWDSDLLKDELMCSSFIIQKVFFLCIKSLQHEILHMSDFLAKEKFLSRVANEQENFLVLPLRGLYYICACFIKAQLWHSDSSWHCWKISFVKFNCRDLIKTFPFLHFHSLQDEETPASDDANAQQLRGSKNNENNQNNINTILRRTSKYSIIVMCSHLPSEMEKMY